ncbi:hypothetical protein Dimus_010314 [Dionaea muscipula]
MHDIGFYQDFSVSWLLVWDYDFRKASADDPLEIHRIFKVKWWEKFEFGFIPPIESVSIKLCLSTPILDSQLLTLRHKKAALEKQISQLKRQVAVSEDSQTRMMTMIV